MKKVGFCYINSYFRGIVSLRKRINDFSQLQQLHKSQTPLLALSRGKTTDKVREKEKRTFLEILSRRRKKDREWQVYTTSCHVRVSPFCLRGLTEVRGNFSFSQGRLLFRHASPPLPVRGLWEFLPFLNVFYFISFFFFFLYPLRVPSLVILISVVEVWAS